LTYSTFDLLAEAVAGLNIYKEYRRSGRQPGTYLLVEQDLVRFGKRAERHINCTRMVNRSNNIDVTIAPVQTELGGF